MPQMLNQVQYAAIGRVATQAARLDSLLESFLADAITNDADVAVIATRNLFFERRVDLLLEVLSVRVPESEELNRLRPVLGEAKRLMKDRNQFLHGLWQFDAEANLEVRNRVRSTGKLAVRAVSVEELMKTADRIDAVAEQIEDLYLDMLVDIGAYRPLSPGIWRRIPPHRPLSPETVHAGDQFVIDMSNVDNDTAN